PGRLLPDHHGLPAGHVPGEPGGQSAGEQADPGVLPLLRLDPVRRRGRLPPPGTGQHGRRVTGLDGRLRPARPDRAAPAHAASGQRDCPGRYRAAGRRRVTLTGCRGLRWGERMRAVLHLAGHELGARWRSWAVLVLVVAFAGGAVLTAVAGALRTDTAYPRFLKASRASDVLVAPNGSGLGGYMSAVARLPDVKGVAPVAGLDLTVLGHGSVAARASNIMAPVDGRFGHLVEVPKVLAGRLPAAGRAGEIAIDQRAAAMMDLQVGDVLTMRAVPDGQPPSASAAGQRLLRERVTGIVVTRGSVFPVNEQDKNPTIMASPALFHRLGARYLG